MTKRRFIAGAVCPQCKAIDKIVVFGRGDRDVRQCVACGFEEVKNFLPDGNELPTRVNQTAGIEVGSDAEVVKIIGDVKPQRQ